MTRSFRPNTSLFIGLIALFIAAAPLLHAAEEPAGSSAPQVIVEAESLAELLKPAANADSAGRPVVLDVRDGEAYARGHLAGAVHLDGAQWKSESLAAESGLEHQTLWTQRIAALGVSGRAPIVIYDDGGMTEAARIWFVLQHFGVANALVLNGGFKAIEPLAGEGRLTLSTKPVKPAPAEFRPASKSGVIGLAERERVKAAIERGEAQIFDARSSEEFSGANKGKNPRGGHLPGALNLTHTKLLDANGRLRPPAELAMLFEEAGFQRGRPIIVHCQSGGRSSLAALAAEQAGFGPVMNYYMSFGDWASDQSCPVVSGD